MTNPLHPAQLRASAALWTLRAALAALDDRADEEHRAIADQRAAAAEPLQSPVWGRRQALGGHGDPTGAAILTMGATRPNQWAELLAEVFGQLRDVAQHLPVTGFHPIARIGDALPTMSPAAADATRLLADRIDSRIRRKLRLDHDRQFVPRVPCPACDVVELVIRTSPPPSQRVVECMTCGQAWPWTAMVGSAAA